MYHAPVLASQPNPPPDLIDRLTSFGFLAAALIVLVFGVFALISVLRIYRKRLFRDPAPPTSLRSAWDESAKRMPTPPPEDSGDADSDDDDDDDDGEPPRPPAPAGGPAAHATLQEASSR